MNKEVFLMGNWDIDSIKRQLSREVLVSRNKNVVRFYARIMDLVDRLAEEADCFPFFVSRVSSVRKKYPNGMAVFLDIRFRSPYGTLVTARFDYLADPSKDRMVAWAFPLQENKQDELSLRELCRLAYDVTPFVVKPYSELPLKYQEGMAFAPWLAPTSAIAVDSDFDWIIPSLVLYILLMRNYYDTSYAYFEAISPPSTAVLSSWIAGYSPIDGTEEFDAITRVGDETEEGLLLGVEEWMPIAPYKVSPNDSLVFVQTRRIEVDLSRSEMWTLAKSPYLLKTNWQEGGIFGTGNREKILDAIIRAETQRKRGVCVLF